ILADLKTPDLTVAGCAGLTLATAQPPAMGDPLPHYDGGDTFKIGATRGVKLYGGISGGKLSTTPSKSPTAEASPKLDFVLALGGGDVLPPTVSGCHVEGKPSQDRAQPTIVDGQPHGALPKKDTDRKITPAVATLVTKQINDKPTGSSTGTIIGIFENMQ